MFCRSAFVLEVAPRVNGKRKSYTLAIKDADGVEHCYDSVSPAYMHQLVAEHQTSVVYVYDDQTGEFLD